MNNEIVIKVTQSNIDEGISGSGTKCPIALALRELDGDLWSVGDGVCGRVRDCGYYDLPYDAHVFMSEFDRGEAVLPSTFVAIFSEHSIA